MNQVITQNRREMIDENQFSELGHDEQVTYLRSLTFTSGCAAQYAGMAKCPDVPQRIYSDRWQNSDLLAVYKNANEILLHAINYLNENKRENFWMGIWPYESRVYSLIETVESGSLRIW